MLSRIGVSAFRRRAVARRAQSEPGMTLTIHVRPGRTPGWFQVFAPELPGCSASGPSVSEAVQRLRLRIDDHLADARRRAPAPGTRRLQLEV